MMTTKHGYSLLAIMAGFYLAFVYRYQSTPRYVLFATAGFAFLYLLWGIFHHLKSGALTGKIVLEYFLVATLALALVSTLLI